MRAVSARAIVRCRGLQVRATDGEFANCYPAGTALASCYPAGTALATCDPRPGTAPRSDWDSPQREPAFKLRLDRELGSHLRLEHKLSFVVATLV